MQTNDLKYAALVGLGIPATAMPEMHRAWLISLGADTANGDTRPDLEWDLLTRVAGLTGSLSDMWYAWLGNLGYTGSASDRWNEFWQNSAASIDADTAVGRLVSPSASQKHIVWAYVHKESAADRWQYISRLYLARVNLASSYVCLKTGTAATPSGTFTYTANEGVVIPDGDTVNYNYNSSTEFGSSGYSDFCYGSYFSATSGVTGTYYLLTGRAGSTPSGWLAYDSVGNDLIGAIGGSSVRNVPTGLPDCESHLSRIDIDSATGYPRLRVCDYDAIGTFAPFAGFMPTVWKQNDQTGSATGSQTWGLTYFADSDLDWTNFVTSTEKLMSDLA